MILRVVKLLEIMVQAERHLTLMFVQLETHNMVVNGRIFSRPFNVVL